MMRSGFPNFLLWLLLAGLCLFPLGLFPLGLLQRGYSAPPENSPPAKEPSDTQIAKWVEQLESDLFQVRERAMKQLIEAESRAAPAVAKVLMEGSLESQKRAVVILRVIGMDILPELFKTAQEGPLEQNKKVQSLLAGLLVDLLENSTDEPGVRKLWAKLHQNGLDSEAFKDAWGRRTWRIIKQTKNLQIQKDLGDMSVAYATYRTAEQLEPSLYYLQWARSPRIISLAFSATQLTDDDLVQVAQFEALKGLHLDATHVSDAGMEAIKNLKNLTELSLKKTKISDAGIATLAGGSIRKLRYLDLESTEITDKSFENLAKITADSDLEILFEDTAITGEGLRFLKEKKFVDISLAKCNVTDATMEHLKDMGRLVYLDLSHTPISDAGIATLAGGSLRGVRWLNLSHTKITDQGFQDLAKITAREIDIYLDGTATTGKGFRFFKGKEIPELSMENCKATDATIAHLFQNIKSGLTELNLSGNQITGPGLAQIHRVWPSNHYLDIKLARCPLTDKGVKLVAGNRPRIEYLDLSDTAVTDAGLKHLDGIIFKRLLLDHCDITDAGIKHLFKATYLNELGLQNTKVTQESIKKLKAVYPGLRLTPPSETE